MDYRYNDQQTKRQLLNIVDRGSEEQLFVGFEYQSLKIE